MANSVRQTPQQTQPPSLAEMQEAYRLLHNLAAEYASYATLEAALQVCIAAATGYEALVSKHQTLVQQIATAQRELDGWQAKVKDLAERYRQREAEAEQAVQAR